MKKTSILTAILILAITSIWIASGQFEPNLDESNNEEVQVNEETIKKINVRTKNSLAEEINKSIIIQGQTNANKIINIKSETQGKIVKINDKIGKKIKKGELLFKISEKDLIINLDERKSKFKEMEIKYNAEKNLFQKGLSSEAKLAVAKSNLETAKSNYEFIKNEIDKTNIFSPFDGILTSEHLEIGEYVQPGTIIGNIVELDPILVIGYASEKQLKNLKINSKAIVKTSLNEKYEGVITYISPIAEKGTRTFKIEIKISNTDLIIKDGLTASIEIQGEKILAHKISPSILTLKDNGEVGIKIVNNNNFVEFYQINVVSDTNEGMWISGIPNNSNIIVVGQEYASVGEEVNFEKIN